MRKLAALVGVLCVLGGRVAAQPFSGSTTCTEVGPTLLCSSGNGRGFNGQSYQLGPTRYWNGEADGRRVNCQQYQLGASVRWSCQ